MSICFLYSDSVADYFFIFQHFEKQIVRLAHRIVIHSYITAGDKIVFFLNDIIAVQTER